MRFAVVAIACGIAGCGRLGFPLRAAPDGGADAADDDAPASSRRCNALSWQLLATSNGGAHPTGAAVRDLDGDGFADAVFTQLEGGVVDVLHSNGDGTFGAETPYATGDMTFAVTTGNLDGNAAPDLIVTDALTKTIGVFLGAGDGTFGAQQTTATPLQPAGVVAADLDGDHLDDVIVTNFQQATFTVHGNVDRGDLGPGVTYTVQGQVVAIAAADLDGDGDVDLVVVDDSPSLDVFVNRGDGSFGDPAQLPIDPGTDSVALADLDGDDAPDLVVANGVTGAVSVYRGDRAAGFGMRHDYPIGASAAQAIVADVDGDGVLDVAAIDGLETTAVLLGNGDGTLSPGGTFGTDVLVYDIAAGDFDGDGTADFAIANDQDDSTQLWRTTCTP